MWRALQSAAERGDLQTMRELLDAGSDATAKLLALEWAASSQQPDAVSMLLEYGALVDGHAVLAWAGRSCLALSMATEGDQPTSPKSRKRQRATVQVLLTAGADASPADEMNSTTAWVTLKGNRPILLMLMRSGADAARTREILQDRYDHYDPRFPGNLAWHLFEKIEQA